MHEAASRQLFEQAVKGIGAELCEARGWTVHTAIYPIVEIEFTAPERTPIRMRATCDGWNGQALSIEWLNGDGLPLTSIPQAPGGQFNNGPHPQTGRPFVCMAGVREYHTHPSHVTDVWENYKSRPGYDLGGVVTQVWRVWQQARP